MISKISGFPEYLPEYQIAFNKVIDVIKRHFELYGFCPLETPAVERVSTLLAKGNDSEIYGIYRLADERDKKDLALRFDLTVPLARYVAQHSEELVFPYRRYHIAPVWRGERPQAGRYRQFYQCDIDIIDSADLPITCDAEVLRVVYGILKELNLDFEIKINNKKILDGMLRYILGDAADLAPILRIIDKKDKITSEEFSTQLENAGMDASQIKKMLDFFEVGCDNNSTIERLQEITFNDEFCSGVKELQELYSSMLAFGIDPSNIAIDLKLARGLTYYTGSIFETKLRGVEFSGSISGGGRYDNLTSLFCKKKYPGVGVTLGITRLIPILFEQGLVRTDEKTPARILVTTQDDDMMNAYICVATALRSRGVNTEVFLQKKKLAHQMTYANKKGFKFAVIANRDELSAGTVNIKNLLTGEQMCAKINELDKINFGE